SVVTGVIRVRSKTVRGASEIKVDFTPGTDMVQTLNDVRAKLAEVEASLPAGANTLVPRQSPSSYPLISLVVTGRRNLGPPPDCRSTELGPRMSRLRTST